jgi:hypothetical protein
LLLSHNFEFLHFHQSTMTNMCGWSPGLHIETNRRQSFLIK